MPLITQTLQGFTYSGPPLPIAAQPWAGNVNALFCTGENGASFISYESGSEFNVLTTLQNGMTYYVRSRVLGYTIPEVALVTIAPSDRYIYSPDIPTAIVPMLP